MSEAIYITLLQQDRAGTLHLKCTYSEAECCRVKKDDYPMLCPPVAECHSTTNSQVTEIKNLMDKKHNESNVVCKPARQPSRLRSKASMLSYPANDAYVKKGVCR